MRRVERLTAKRPWETLGMSYRVARIYDRLGQEQGRGQGDPWAWSGVARPTLTSYRSEKAGNFAPGQGGQGGHGGSTAPSGETRRHASASDGAPPVEAMPAISRTGHHRYPDHPDHASELKGLSGQGSLAETAPTLTGPPWPDLDILRRAYGEARGVEAKRAMVAAWAAAAGGLVTGGVLRLPRDLPKGLKARPRRRGS